MKAFFGNEFIKEDYVYQIRQHQLADEIIQGRFWENGKGCAVGCTIHDSNHSKYETELGVPVWLAKLEDTIFEGLPNKIAKQWPLKFLKAIPLNADLDTIKFPMLIFIIESARESTTEDKSIRIIDSVLEELHRPVLDLVKLQKARSAAASDAASYTAAVAASYAAASAVSYTAASAVSYAASAASYAASDASYAASDAASYAASAAARAGAKQDIYIKFATKLLELLKNCK